MWFKESNRYFCKIENFAYREINGRSFSNPTPGELGQHIAPYVLAPWVTKASTAMVLTEEDKWHKKCQLYLQSLDDNIEGNQHPW